MSLILVLVVVWGVVVAVWLGLDWLADPNRGRFRPQRDRRARGAGSWRERRSLRVRRDDALVRSVLRDRYGRSSLRLHWSEEQEADARAADEDVATRSQTARPVPVLDEADFPLAPVVELYDGRADEPDDEDDEPEPEIATDEHDEPEPEIATAEAETDEDDDEPLDEEDEPEPETDDEPVSEVDEGAVPTVDGGPAWALPTSGWRVGDDPLAPTRRGTPPPATTVRSRVWKNVGEHGIWDDDNRDRLRAGKPPRRRNPLRRAVEHASVDVDTGTASWPDPALDPFASGSVSEESA